MSARSILSAKIIAAKITVRNVRWYRNLINSTYAKLFIIVWLLLMPAVARGQTPSPNRADDALFETALRWILSPSPGAIQYDYLMTARVRLLLFWVGADDVGGGYIRRSKDASDPNRRMIQVLFGSDPAKAPRKINYWGAAIERSNDQSSALLGFMKAAKTGSASEAEADIRRQTAQAQHPFEAILSVVQKDRALSRRTPLFSNTDLNLHELDRAFKIATDQLGENRPIRELAGTQLECRNPRGFLQAVDELVDYALSHQDLPRFVCYAHNARNYTVSLQKRSRISKHSVRIQRKNGTKLERTYHDLLDAHFSVFNHSSGERTTFQLLLGTSGPLKGVPVQIVHQPNWWFRVVLNLDAQ